MREQARRERIANNMFVWTAIAATILVCPLAIFYVLAYDIVPVIVPLAGIVMFALVYLLGIRPMRPRSRPASPSSRGMVYRSRDGLGLFEEGGGFSLGEGCGLIGD